MAVRICPCSRYYNGVMSNIDIAAVSSPMTGLVARIDDGVVISASFSSKVTRPQHDSSGVYEVLAAYFDGTAADIGDLTVSHEELCDTKVSLAAGSSLRSGQGCAMVNENATPGAVRVPAS